MADLDRSDGPEVPPTNYTLLAAAGVCLLIPIVAVLWVTSYARETPRLWGFPFFFWYQFLWVFLCAGLTYAAHRLVLAARKPGRGSTGKPGQSGDSDHGGDEGGRR